MLGRILLAENVHGVQAAYGDGILGQVRGIDVAGYRFNPNGLPGPDPSRILSAVACWRYQTEEFAGHDANIGWQAMDALYERAARALHADEWEIVRNAPPALPAAAVPREVAAAQGTVSTRR